MLRFFVIFLGVFFCLFAYAENNDVVKRSISKHVSKKINSVKDDRIKNVKPQHTKENITTQKIGNNTFVRGMVVNHGSVSDTGDSAKAVGSTLNIEEEGKVHVNAVMVQRGNVDAKGGTSAEAIGTQVRLGENATAGNINVKSIVSGNITATASNHGDAEAKAAGTQVEVNKSNASTNISVNSRTGAALNAIAEGR